MESIHFYLHVRPSVWNGTNSFMIRSGEPSISLLNLVILLHAWPPWPWHCFLAMITPAYKFCGLPRKVHFTFGRCAVSNKYSKKEYFAYNSLRELVHLYDSWGFHIILYSQLKQLLLGKAANLVFTDISATNRFFYAFP